jgi:hypothetical protein
VEATIYIAQHVLDRWQERIGDGDPAEALEYASQVPRNVPVRLRGERTIALYSKQHMAMFVLHPSGTRHFTAMTVYRPDRRWLKAFHHLFDWP